jgi:hypothetical protein
MPTKNTRKPPSTTWGSKERRIHVTVSDPGNGSQLYGDHRHGDPSSHPEVGQQKGQSVTNAAQSSHCLIPGASGVYWTLAGAFFTLLPPVQVGFVARIIFKLISLQFAGFWPAA